MLIDDSEFQMLSEKSGFVHGESSEHAVDLAEMDPCFDEIATALMIFTEAAVVVPPRKRAFDDPPFGKHFKSAGNLHGLSKALRPNSQMVFLAIP